MLDLLAFWGLSRQKTGFLLICEGDLSLLYSKSKGFFNLKSLNYLKEFLGFWSFFLSLPSFGVSTVDH